MKKPSKRLKKHLFEALVTSLVCLDLAWWHTGAIAGLGLSGLLAAYLWYRREAALNAARSAPLRRRMRLVDIRRLEKAYTQRDDFNTQAKRAALRSPLDRAYYHGRYTRVQQLASRHLSGCRRVLDLGCGFGRNTRYMQRALARTAVGLDLDELKIAEARRTAETEGTAQPLWLCGDACRPSLKNESVDGILCTEVLEHLIDPAAGLAACRRLLVDGGRLVLTVPSHHNLGYTVNPFKAVERLVSCFTDRVLPPYHHLHAQFAYNWRKPEPEYGIHYHFTWRRITELLDDNGFGIRWQGSFEIECFPYLLVEWLVGDDVGRIGRMVGPVENALVRLPLIGRMGQHLLILAEKRYPT